MRCRRLDRLPFDFPGKLPFDAHETTQGGKVARHWAQDRVEGIAPSTELLELAGEVRAWLRACPPL
jgi:hypothetical protein